jgi:hypothetical protein
VVIAGAFGVLAFTGALPGSVQDPVRERVASISTHRIEANRYDSYRISEQINVIHALRGSPLLGLGLGVPWEASSPLTLQFDNARVYSHFIVTALWLKIGVLGVLAYLVLMGGALRCAWLMWSRSPTPTRAAAGLAAGAGMAGLLLAETTASFTGVEVRETVLVGVVLGLLAAETSRLPAG